jgi:glycosyltransferase involved in cell wall biosynthesis
VKLLHVVPTYLPATRYGGPIYSVHALCAALARRGHEVHVYTTNVDGPDNSAVPLGVATELDGVRVWYFSTGAGRRLYRSPDMGHALDRTIASFDIVHLHSVFLWPTTKAARTARRAGVPYFLAPRGMLVGDLIDRKSRHLKRAWIRAFEQSNLAHAAAVHVTSTLEAEEIAELGLATRGFAIVPNGIDLPFLLDAKGSTPCASQSRRPTILALGRLSWKKGLDRLIPAMVHVPQAQLIIAGNDDENYRPQLEAIARQNGVLERTTFTGPVHGAAKWQLLASADVFALPSYSENFGNVVLEAMACAVPVVVSAEVGLASTVAANGAGLVVDGTPAAIGAALARLLADPEERARKGAAGRRTALDQFSWDGIAARLEAHYTRASLGQPAAALVA